MPVQTNIESYISPASDGAVTSVKLARLTSGVQIVNSISISNYEVTTTVANTTSFTSGNNCVILGKNGFKSQIGTTRLLCTNKDLVQEAGYSERVICLTLDGLNKCFNLNTQTNIATNLERIEIPLKDKAEGIVLELNKYPTVTKRTVSVIRTDILNNRVYILNIAVGTNQRLFSQIPDNYFYVVVEQNLTNTSNNYAFVQGAYRKKVLKGYASRGDSVEIGFPVRNKDHVTTYIDESKTNRFSLSNSNTEITFTGAEDTFDYYIEIDKYDFPIYEINDVVAVDDGQTFKIQDTTYSGANANSTLSDSYVYAVTLNRTFSNLQSQYLTNISKDPIGVSTISGQDITIDSENTGIFSLANTYIVADDYKEDSLEVVDNRVTVRDVDEGIVAILARNERGSVRSPYITAFAEDNRNSV